MGSRNSGAGRAHSRPRDSWGPQDEGTKTKQHVLRSGQSKVGFGDHKKGRGIGVLASPRCYWARRSKPVSKLTRAEIGAQR